MNLLFESPSWILSCAILVLISVLLSLWLLYEVRKHFAPEDLKKSHDVVGYTFSIIGVLYSVILGFTVVNVQERYNDVIKIAQTEAITLADLYRDASLFQQTEQEEIRQNLREYVNLVVREEWWAPGEKGIHAQTYEIIEKIWNSYHSIDLSSERTQIWYTESVSKLNNLLDARLSRQFNSSNHLSSMMWSLLILGAIITVIFMCFFGLESLKSQMLITSLLVAYLTFMLHLVYSLDHVFKGPQGIKPVALEQVLTLFDRWDQI